MTQRSVGRSIVSVSEHAAGEDEQVCLFPTLVWGVASLRYKMGGKEEETKDKTGGRQGGRQGMHQASSDLVLSMEGSEIVT